MGLVSFVALSASTAALAAPSAEIEFTGEITEAQLLEKLCVVEAKEDGKLVPGDRAGAMTTLIANGGSEGKKAKVEVAVGKGLTVTLTAANPRLTRNDTDVTDSMILHSGFLVPPSFDADNNRVIDPNENKTMPISTGPEASAVLPFDIWFFCAYKGWN